MSKLLSSDTSYRDWIQEVSKRFRQSQIRPAVKVNDEILAANGLFQNSEMQFCHISGYSSFSPVHSYEWTFLARRYGDRCPPCLVSTLLPADGRHWRRFVFRARWLSFCGFTAVCLSPATKGSAGACSVYVPASGLLVKAWRLAQDVKRTLGV